ncbi:DUF4314 domain-containing protein [Eubacteriales bacterium OttesenSCG-928-A19]|nr:DUF4314 domain-containing protein [Eubacteriales bacterium OttesenSCG-928-A19]
MNFPSRDTIKALRSTYPEGTRIALVEMSDPYAKLAPGDQGTVAFVDDAGGVHIQWDCGSTLAAIHGVDRIRKI